MKREPNRQNIDTLYVLGAGASYSLSHINSRKNDHNSSETPLDKDFLACLEHSKPNNGWRKEATELLNLGFLDEEPLTNFGLEEAIIKRVSQYDFLKSLHPTRLRGKCSNEDYLNNLSHLITYYLKRCKSNSSGSTKKFINKIFPAGTEVEKYKNRIITFNYDTLVIPPKIHRGYK